MPTKFQEDKNVFFIQTAPDASYAKKIEDLQKYEIGDLIQDIKKKILQRSAFGIRGIARIFKAMDDKGDKNLDVDDFRWGLMDFGISITKEEAVEVLGHFDRDRNGTVNFDEFLRTLKVSTISTTLPNDLFILGRPQRKKNCCHKEGLCQVRRYRQWLGHPR